MRRNWRHLLMTFLMSFPNVLNKTIDWKDLEELYDLFSFGMTIVIEDLKYNSYQPISKHVLAIFMILLRQTSLLIINLRYVKIIERRLHFSVFNLIFLFFFIFIFLFSIFRTTRVRVRKDWSHCHISHNLIVWSQHWSQDLEE